MAILPAGRPPGIRDRRVQLADRILDAGPALIEKLLENALAGEPLALKLCVERLLPKAARHPLATTPYRDPHGQTVEAAGRSVLALAVAGELSPDEAATLLTGLGRQAIACSRSASSPTLWCGLPARLGTCPAAGGRGSRSNPVNDRPSSSNAHQRRRCMNITSLVAQLAKSERSERLWHRALALRRNSRTGDSPRRAGCHLCTNY